MDTRTFPRLPATPSASAPTSVSSPSAVVTAARRYLDTIAAAAYLELSERTLEAYRHRGGGPAYHKFGRRVRYTVTDLDAWADAQRRLNTSQPVAVTGTRR